jgi:hypothetical protein
MKNFFKIIIVLLAVFIVAGTLSYGILTSQISALIYSAVEKARDKGVVLDNVTFNKVGISSFNSLSIRNISAEWAASEKQGFARNEKLFVYIDRVDLVLENYQQRALAIELVGLTVTSELNAIAAKNDIGKEDVQVDRFVIRTDLRSFDLREVAHQLDELSTEFMRCLKDGKINLPLELSGSVAFTYKGAKARGRILAEWDGKESVIYMEKEDIKALCRLVNEKVWDEEVEVLYRHPLRVPKVIKIRDYASAVSSERVLQMPQVPQKVYRHVLWSYLLTREYGAKFAEALTTAHEARDDPDEVEQTPENVITHKMDLNNNRVGRRYAESGFSEESLLKHVADDPEIIFSPGLAPGRNPWAAD